MFIFTQFVKCDDTLMFLLFSITHIEVKPGHIAASIKIENCY